MGGSTAAGSTSWDQLARTKLAKVVGEAEADSIIQACAEATRAKIAFVGRRTLRICSKPEPAAWDFYDPI
jgi:hypothetical protein